MENIDSSNYTVGEEVFIVNIGGKDISVIKRNGKFIKPEELRDVKGKGTSTKPSVENWWLCRKPISEKNIADNVKPEEQQQRQEDYIDPFIYAAKASKSEKNKGCEDGNGHPTVKAQKLMSYLVNLITPEYGTVLDPFMGSGSTIVAAINNGYNYIGIEKELDYMTIAIARVNYALQQREVNDGNKR